MDWSDCINVDVEKYFQEMEFRLDDKTGTRLVLPAVMSPYLPR